MKKYSYEKLIQMLQEGKIGHLGVVMNCPELRNDFIDWCKGHQLNPDDTSAEFWLTQTQLTDEEAEGLKNANIVYYL